MLAVLFWSLLLPWFFHVHDGRVNMVNTWALICTPAKLKKTRRTWRCSVPNIIGQSYLQFSLHTPCHIHLQVASMQNENRELYENTNSTVQCMSVGSGSKMQQTHRAYPLPLEVSLWNDFFHLGCSGECVQGSMLQRYIQTILAPSYSNSWIHTMPPLVVLRKLFSSAQFKMSISTSSRPAF